MRSLLLSSTLSALLVLCALTWSASGQAYSPMVSLNAPSTCGSTTFVKVGNDASANFTQYGATGVTVGSGYVYLTAANHSTLGSQLTQMTLALGDNSALAAPVLLRLGVYSLSAGVGSGVQGTLVGQTGELVLYPSGPQLLVANLLQPVVTIASNQYGLGVTTSNNFKAFGGGGVTSYYAYAYAAYDYSLPAAILGTASATYSTAIAASGCYDPSTLSSAGTSLYAFCGYVETYAPSPSTTDYTQVSSTTQQVFSGLIVANSSSPTTKSFGSGLAVATLKGSVTTTRSGQNSFQLPQIATLVDQLSGTTTQSIASTSPTNLIYPSGSAALVDASGLSLVASSGTAYLLQWQAATLQYQLRTTTGAVSGTTALSGFTLTPISASNPQVPVCAPIAPVYTPPSVPSCPAGSQAVTLGDVTSDLSSVYYVASGTGYVSGNVLYFRPFYVQVAGTQVLSLSTYLFPNPNAIVHARIGLYALNGSITTPSWTLLSQTPEQVLANPLAGNITVPLPSVQTLGVGVYAVGVWFDAPVYSLATSWDAAPQPFNLYAQYTSQSSSGAMPAYAVPQADYSLAPGAANACVPGQSTTQFSICAAFRTGAAATAVDVYSGTLTVLSNKYSGPFGSYWNVVSGNISRVGYLQYPMSAGSVTSPTPNRLYDVTTTSGGVALDTAGVQFYANYLGSEPYTFVLKSVLAPFTPTYAYAETLQLYYGAPTTYSGYGPGQFTYASYTAGSPIPNCTYTAPTYINLVLPTPPAQETCTAYPGYMRATFGDTAISDFANQAEGNAIPASTIYTNAIIVQGSVILTQLAVDVLGNTAQNLSLQLGLYTSAGALLASTAQVLLAQVYDRQIILPLTTPATLTAGTYLVAVMASASLNIATSASATSPSASVASFSGGLPAQMSVSGTAAAVPVTAFGCAVATHTFCSIIQYYLPQQLGGPTTYAYVYQGVLAATSNADGSLSAVVVDIHGTYFQRYTSVPNNNLYQFTQLSLAAPSRLYPGAAQPVDATGLQLYSATVGSLNLTYNAALGQYVDTWGRNAQKLATIQYSQFSLTTVGTSGTLVPACNVLTLPQSVSPPLPSPPTCPSGQTPVTLGDNTKSDYTYSQEEDDYINGGNIVTRVFTTGNATLSIAQVGLGLMNNMNTLVRMSFAVYGRTGLLGYSHEVNVSNPQNDLTVVASLQAPVTLQPRTTYYFAMWADNSLFLEFSAPNNNPCGAVPYIPGGTAWPALVPNTGSCAGLAIVAYGCTTAPPSSATSPPTTTPTPTTTAGTGGASPTSAASPASPTTSPSTSIPPPPPQSTSTSSSSNDVSLSKGAVAGIVVGCVVGTNLLVLLCLFLMCNWSLKGSGDGVQKAPKNRESEPQSRVELAPTTEPSRVGDTA